MNLTENSNLNGKYERGNRKTQNCGHGLMRQNSQEMYLWVKKSWFIS